MRRGYIRLSVTGPTLDQQKDALRRAGIEDFSDHGPVYIDEAPRRSENGKPALPERATLIRSLRPNAADEVVISDEGVLGTSFDDTARALAQIAEKSATVYVVNKTKTITWHPGAAEAIDLMREAEHQRALWRAAHARRAATGARRGGKRALTGKRLEAARAAWFDVTKSGGEVAQEFEVGLKTLHTYFGPRGTPRFGGKGRRKST